MATLCAICNAKPGTQYTPCECKIHTCDGCTPDEIPTVKELAEEYGSCTGDYCAYLEYAEDKHFNWLKEQSVEQYARYSNNAPWYALPDCRCADLSACQCDVKRA